MGSALRQSILSLVAVLSIGGMLASCGPYRPTIASDERYSFSGRAAGEERAQQNSQLAENSLPDLSVPQEQLRQEDETNQMAGTAAPRSSPDDAGGVSTSQTDRSTAERYANPIPDYESMIQQDAGRTSNAPGEDNTSTATGSNIFGTTGLPVEVVGGSDS